MTLFEMRIVTVLGLLVLGVIAILATLAAVHLRDLAQRLNGGIARARVRPSLRGDTHATARAIDHRQAAWRLRC